MTSANFWELAHLSDQGLRHGLRELIGSRCRMEARVVAHLAAIEERRLHLVDGFSSMFDFCLRQLGLSESEAYHRIAAARVARQFPVVFGMIDRGEIHLSALWNRRWRFGWTKYRSGVLRKRTSRGTRVRPVSDCGSR
jgi:hypothetical protein